MDKQRILVTGASGAIGQAIALELSQIGYTVTIHYRNNVAAAQELSQQISSLYNYNPELLCFDVADREVTKAAIENSINQHGAYYGTVLNAGIYRDAPFAGFEDADWDDVLKTNLDAFYNILRPLIMPMIQLRQGGRIVVMSSLSGITGNRGQVNYSAAKAGLIGAAKSLAKELAKRRISVNCVAPGFIAGEMTKDLDQQNYISSIPMQRAGRPDEVAALVGFLFNSRAEYITGQVISINGGII